MRLTPGLFVALVLAALVFFAVPVVGSSSACGEAEDHFEHDRTAAAEKAYADILADDPDSECAAEGMTKVIDRRCTEAKKLAEYPELLKEAEKAYVALLDLESPSEPRHAARNCALEDLPAVRRRLKATEKSTEDTTNG